MADKETDLERISYWACCINQSN